MRPQMRDCYELSTNAYFFYLEQEQKSWMSGRVLFDAPVDVPLLQKAADELFRAMPFLSVRKEVPPEGDRYVLVPCSLPFRVTDRSEKTSPESRESGGALISVSCEGSALYLEMSHALTDGCGFVAVMRYLVIRYLSLLWDDQPEPAGSRKPPLLFPCLRRKGGHGSRQGC